MENEEIRNELHVHVLQLYHNVDRQVLGHTLSPLQWVPRYFYITGIKRPRHEANNCRLLPRLRMLAAYAFMLWTGKTLPVFCGLQGLAVVNRHYDTVGSTAVPFKGGQFGVQDLQGLRD
jgi:hypothetical protein